MQSAFNEPDFHPYIFHAEVNIAKHLADLGIEEEFGNHAQIRGLSGGQKVKVVLAACTWLSPHIIVLVSL